MTKRRFWTGAVAVLATGAMVLPGAASAQASLSERSTRLLQQEGLITSYFGGLELLAKQVEVGPDSRSDRAALLAGCEAVMAKDAGQATQLAPSQPGYDMGFQKSVNILASAVDVLKQARTSPAGRKLLNEVFDVPPGGYTVGKWGAFFLGPASGSERTFACFLRVAQGLVSATPRSSGSSAASAPSSPAPAMTTAPTMSDLLKMHPDDVRKLAGKPGDAASGPRAQLPPPPPPAPPTRSYTGYNSAETQALIDQLLKPQGPSAAVGMSSRPMVDLAALAAGGPASESSKRDDAAARQAYEAGKTRKVHNSLNDATACLRVEPTGVRNEWGMEGRYRLINSCDYPVSASWCANTRECELRRGNLWTIRPRGGYPIYFADLANPQIQIGGCREGEGKQPLPSDADFSRQGGVSEARAQPIPAPGVSLLPSHRCD